MQVASSFLIEVGNGDKFLFDMGSGSYQNLLATGQYAIDKVGKLCSSATWWCCLHKWLGGSNVTILPPPHSALQNVDSKV